MHMRAASVRSSGAAFRSPSEAIFVFARWIDYINYEGACSDT